MNSEAIDWGWLVVLAGLVLTAIAAAARLTEIAQARRIVRGQRWPLAAIATGAAARPPRRTQEGDPERRSIDKTVRLELMEKVRRARAQ